MRSRYSLVFMRMAGSTNNHHKVEKVQGYSQTTLNTSVRGSDGDIAPDMCKLAGPICRPGMACLFAFAFSSACDRRCLFAFPQDSSLSGQCCASCSAIHNSSHVWTHHIKAPHIRCFQASSIAPFDNASHGHWALKIAGFFLFYLGNQILFGPLI
jgi:hypothetical protein